MAPTYKARPPGIARLCDGPWPAGYWKRTG